MNLLVIGRGGRESAIVKKSLKDPVIKNIYCAPGNAQTSYIAKNINIEETDINKLCKFAKDNKIDLTIVGPESSLEKGIVNLFNENNLKIFGPTKEAATIETSKTFAKDFMKKYSIPTAKYEKFTNSIDAINYAKDIDYPHVIKYDGLASGKGVIICNNFEEMKLQIKNMLDDKSFGNNKIILEEFLLGEEFTLLSIVHNDIVYPLEISRDYKKAYDNNKGLNTGGMGSICPFDKINDKQKEEAINILNLTASSLMKENKSFTGVLYGGFIATKEGVKVIEYNARFGDPETEVVLQKLDNDLPSLLLDVLDNKNISIKNNNYYYVGITMAALGYPSTYKKDININSFDDEGIFHMGTTIKNDKLVSNGGRVIFISAKGKDLNTAIINAYKKVESFKNKNLFFRTDIGK